MPPVNGPELVLQAGLADANAHPYDGQSRFGRWVAGWLLGHQGLGGGAIDAARMFDPRSAGGLLNIASAFAGRTPESIQGEILPFAKPVASGGEIVNQQAAQAILAKLGATRDTFEVPLVAKNVGPRRVGGIYRSGYSGEAYRVNSIHADQHGNFSIGVETVPEPGRPNFGRRTHMTSWDAGRDQVLYQPPDSASPVQGVNKQAINKILAVLGSHSARDLQANLLRDETLHHRQ